MDNVIADHTLHKRWRGIVTVDALGVIYVPLRPVLHASCAAIAGRSLRGRVSWLQSAAVVGIAGPIIAEPNDPNVTIGVGEGVSRQTQLDVGRDADVDATEGSRREVLRYIVRGHEDLV